MHKNHKQENITIQEKTYDIICDKCGKNLGKDSLSPYVKNKAHYFNIAEHCGFFREMYHICPQCMKEFLKGSYYENN